MRIEFSAITTDELGKFLADPSIVELTLDMSVLTVEMWQKDENKKKLREILACIANKTTLGILKIKMSDSIKVNDIPLDIIQSIEDTLSKSKTIFEYQIYAIESMWGSTKQDEMQHNRKMLQIINARQSDRKLASTPYDTKSLIEQIIELLDLLRRQIAQYKEKNSIPEFFYPKFIEDLKSISNADISEQPLAIRQKFNYFLVVIANINTDKNPDVDAMITENFKLLEPLLVKLAIAKKKYEWECFIANSAQISGSWSGRQGIYARYCLANVYAAVEFANNQIYTLKARQLYNFLAQKRLEVAISLYQGAIDAIGKPRGSDIGESPLLPKAGSPYVDYYLSLSAQLKRLFVCSTGDKIKDGFEKITLEAGWLKRSVPALRVVRNGVALSTLCFKWEGEGWGNLPSVEIRKIDCPHIQPTLANDLEKIYAQIEEIFHLLIKNRDCTEESLIHVAKLAWYYAQAMMLERGSAATTETFVYTLFKLCGFPLVPYEGKITLDLEAIFEPDLDKFVWKFLNEFFPQLQAFCKDLNKTEIASNIHALFTAKVSPIADARAPLISLQLVK